MTRLTIEIPDDLRTLLDTRAAEVGRTLEDYVQSLVCSDARTIEYGTSAQLKCDSIQQLESLVLEGLATPTRELRADDWNRMRRELIEDYGKNGYG